MTSSSSFKSVVYLARPLLKSASSRSAQSRYRAGHSSSCKWGGYTTTRSWQISTPADNLFIVVGFVVTAVTRQRGINFDLQYLLLSCGALGICIGGVTLPFFASALNTSRLYQISLILLAPFGIIGGIALTSRLRNLSDPCNHSLHIVAIFLGIFLLFNCGWVYEVCQDESTSFALNSSLDYPVFNKQEVLGSSLANRFEGWPSCGRWYI